MRNEAGFGEDSSVHDTRTSLDGSFTLSFEGSLSYRFHKTGANLPEIKIEDVRQIIVIVLLSQ